MRLRSYNLLSAKCLAEKPVAHFQVQEASSVMQDEAMKLPLQDWNPVGENARGGGQEKMDSPVQKASSPLPYAFRLPLL